MPSIVGMDVLFTHIRGKYILETLYKARCDRRAAGPSGQGLSHVVPY